MLDAQQEALYLGATGEKLLWRQEDGEVSGWTVKSLKAAFRRLHSS